MNNKLNKQKKIKKKRIRTETREIEIRKSIQKNKSMESKAVTLRKTNKINDLLARIRKKKKDINNIRNEREITEDPMDLKKIINEYHKQLYTHISDNLQEMDQLFENISSSKIIQKINNLRRFISII